ncbi:MAG: hypothetical protein ABFR50_10790 [Candidatus Fermentibacteria bacterium]
MKFRYTASNVIRGVLIYSIGDTIASVILSEFSLVRVLGIMLIGGTVYAFEIPNYFRWIDTKTAGINGLRGSFSRAGLAILYFNPLWIARHLLFIQILQGSWNSVNWILLRLGFYAFIANVPVAFAANYVIQNRISLKWRFFASAVFSSLMAIYYALSQVIF